MYKTRFVTLTLKKLNVTKANLFSDGFSVLKQVKYSSTFFNQIYYRSDLITEIRQNLGDNVYLFWIPGHIITENICVDNIIKYSSPTNLVSCPLYLPEILILIDKNFGTRWPMEWKNIKGAITYSEQHSIEDAL